MIETHILLGGIFAHQLGRTNAALVDRTIKVPGYGIVPAGFGVAE